MRLSGEVKEEGKRGSERREGEGEGEDEVTWGGRRRCLVCVRLDRDVGVCRCVMESYELFWEGEKSSEVYKRSLEGA